MSNSERIPLCAPQIGPEELINLTECIESNFLVFGPFVGEFERLIADYVGASHAVSSSSGTTALHLMLLAAGIKPEDEVITSDLTFIAPAIAIRYVGAWPVFIDAEPQYLQMNCDLVYDFLNNRCIRKSDGVFNRRSGRRVRAILTVHFLGHPVDMNPLAQIAKEFDLILLEDAAQGLGAVYDGTTVGNLAQGAICSFFGNKTITAAGGGMFLTNNGDWAARARYLSNQAKDNRLETSHNEIGYNYRLTNLQAAIGCAQANRLGKYVERKREIAFQYAEELAETDGIEVILESTNAASAFWETTVKVNEKKFGINARQLVRELEIAGVESLPVYEPMHRSRAHFGAEVVGGDVADRMHEIGLSLPSSVGLTSSQQSSVITAIRSASAHRLSKA